MGNPEADSSKIPRDQADYNVQFQHNVHVSSDDNSNDPARPAARFPHHSPQMNPAYANKGAYPPRQQPSYPPTVAAPQRYPPRQQPRYARQNAPQAYPPKLPPPMPYPPSPAYQQQPAAPPVQFPPPAGGEVQVQYVAVPPSLIKPGVQGYSSAAQGFPMQANMMGTVNTEGWKTGLFDCLDDPTNACAMGGMMYGLTGALIGMPCIYSCTYRSKLRSKFGLVESPAPDWIIHFRFKPCALCQETENLIAEAGIPPMDDWATFKNSSRCSSSHRLP